MDSFTSILNQIFAPIMRLTNYWESWFYAACIFFILFLLFFILFLVFCVKNSKRKKEILAKNEYISGLEASLDMPPVDPNGGYLPGDSIVYITNKNKDKKDKVDTVGQALDESLPSVTSQQEPTPAKTDKNNLPPQTTQNSPQNFNANANDIPFNSQVVAGVNSKLNELSNDANQDSNHKQNKTKSSQMSSEELTKLVTETVMQILANGGEVSFDTIDDNLIPIEENNETDDISKVLDENKDIFGENTGSLSPEDIEAAKILQRIKANRPKD